MWELPRSGIRLIPIHCTTREVPEVYYLISKNVGWGGCFSTYPPITFLLLFNRYVVSNSSVTPWTVAPTASSVHGVSQARIPGWVTISFSRGSSRPRDRTMAGGFFTTKPPGMLPYFPCGHTKEYTQCDFNSFIIFFLAARHNLWNLSSQSRD